MQRKLPITLKGLKHAAWLSSGIALSYLHFDILAAMVDQGAIKGRYAPMVISLLVSCAIGSLLCWRATSRHITQLGMTIAGYLPFLYALLWLVASAQDLLRADGMPGRSLAIMMELPPSHMLMGLMAMTGLVVSLSGFFTQCALHRIAQFFTSTRLSAKGAKP